MAWSRWAAASRKPALRGEAGHPPEQGRRVGSAREGDDHALAAGERRLVAEEGRQGVEQKIQGSKGSRGRMVAVTGLEPMT